MIPKILKILLVILFTIGWMYNLSNLLGSSPIKARVLWSTVILTSSGLTIWFSSKAFCQLPIKFAC